MGPGRALWRAKLRLPVPRWERLAARKAIVAAIFYARRASANLRRFVSPMARPARSPPIAVNSIVMMAIAVELNASPMEAVA